jgi:ATPase
MKIEKLAPDSSAIIEGKVSEIIQSKSIEPKLVLIHEALIAELEQEANEEKYIGYLGLDEIKLLKELLKDKLKMTGKKPTGQELKHMSLNEVDTLVRQTAYDEDATLMTSDKVRRRVAESMGIKVHFVELESKSKLILDKFFDETTMSVHLKENVMPYGKKGFPGNWKFTSLRKTVLTQDEIKEISRDIIESAAERKDSFIEIERRGSTIAQVGKFRIVITRPPFSDGWEITAVRPVKKLSLDEYEISKKLMERIEKHAEGVLISGAPGEGKTTIASAIAEFYANNEKIVKTIEAPRDLVLPDSVTQYAISHGDAQEIHDILLLSRPDYTIFDEMRNTNDFKLFTDLRLSGIGLLGVVHATNPIDAIQRFVGRIELGVISQVIDTVLYIKAGKIAKVLSLEMTVKVPSGMVEADLARPVTEVRDFETGTLEFEIYTYGEETIVIPVKGTSSKSPAQSLARKQIEREMLKYTSSVEAEVVSNHKAIVYVPERDIAKIIGTKGKNIAEIEKDIGISIDVQPIKSKRPEGRSIKFEVKERGNNIYLLTKQGAQPVDTYVNNNYLFTSTTSKKGEIKINKKSKLGVEIIKALDLNHKIELKESYL